MKTRREPAPLLLSIAVHIGVAFAILNAAFHYDFSGLVTPRIAAPVAERVTYVDAAPPGGATGGRDSAGPAPRAVRPQTKAAARTILVLFFRAKNSSIVFLMIWRCRTC